MTEKKVKQNRKYNTKNLFFSWATWTPPKHRWWIHVLVKG